MDGETRRFEMNFDMFGQGHMELDICIISRVSASTSFAIEQETLVFK